MAEGDVHTVHRQGVWLNEVMGELRIQAVFLNRGDAVRAGRRLAERNGSTHVMHRENGTVEDKLECRRQRAG